MISGPLTPRGTEQAQRGATRLPALGLQQPQRCRAAMVALEAVARRRHTLREECRQLRQCPPPCCNVRVAQVKTGPYVASSKAITNRSRDFRCDVVA